LAIPFQFHGELDVGVLEFRWPRTSLRVIGPCSQIENTMSTYPSQHFGFFRLELMASFLKAVINMLATRGERGPPWQPLQLAGRIFPDA
jgi:hypothetical protein